MYQVLKMVAIKSRHDGNPSPQRGHDLRQGDANWVTNGRESMHIARSLEDRLTFKNR